MPEIVERTDVRMTEGRGGLRFPEKSPATHRIGDDVIGKDLEGDAAIEAKIPGTVDLAHAPATNKGRDFVGPQSSAHSERHVPRPKPVSASVRLLAPREM